MAPCNNKITLNFYKYNRLNIKFLGINTRKNFVLKHAKFNFSNVRKKFKVLKKNRLGRGDFVKNAANKKTQENFFPQHINFSFSFSP